ncbi:MAG: SDR family oxidoreductase [Deltaproteobacteria bacterium]|nr:SDR family oxidoreductase [Deltaproteobacteria bacterium]
MIIKGKKVLITGGASRLGALITQAFVEKDAEVAIHYFSSQKEALHLKKKFNIHTFQADLGKVRDIKKLFQGIKKTWGELDILINNAAIFYRTPFLKTQEKDWDDFININLKSVFFCSQEASKLMIKKKESHIINIADTGGSIMWPNYLAYCTSKSGVLALTQGLAKTLAPKTCVNAIAPGTLLPPKNMNIKKLEDQSLLKKIGHPEQLISSLVYLLQNDFITGTILYLDGGRQLAER